MEGPIETPEAEAPRREIELRNHPTILAGETVSAFIVFVVIVYATLQEADIGLWGLIPVGILTLIAFLYFVAVWRRTVFTFGPTEIHVVRDMVLTKKDKHIQYSRLASVTVRRDIFNMIFGTSTLMFNVNSSVNAVTAEATLVLRRPEADRLRDELNARVFSKETTVEEESYHDTMIRVSNGDVILNAAFGQPTGQQIFGLLMLIYAVVSLFLDSSGGLITAVILLVFSYVVPLVASILKYFNYRVYRIGDTVTVESGMITHTRRSFKVNKINSVRMRAPLFARLMGRVVLEAEVVGMGTEDERMPILCPLKKRADVQGLMTELVPELLFEPEQEHQPRGALKAMVIANVVVMVAIVAVFALIGSYAAPHIDGLSPFWRATATFLLIAVPLVAIILVAGRVALAQKYRTVSMGPESFLVVHGSYDLSFEFINYDKVQFTEVTSGPIGRVFGVSSCEVHLMSSAGFRDITTGLFDPADLERIADEVNARVRDGRYDYRRYV